MASVLVVMGAAVEVMEAGAAVEVMEAAVTSGRLDKTVLYNLWFT
jgi:hypothetical protein